MGSINIIDKMCIICIQKIMQKYSNHTIQQSQHRQMVCVCITLNKYLFSSCLRQHRYRLKSFSCAFFSIKTNIQKLCEQNIRSTNRVIDAAKKKKKSGMQQNIMPFPRGVSNQQLRHWPEGSTLSPLRKSFRAIGFTRNIKVRVKLHITVRPC